MSAPNKKKQRNKEISAFNKIQEEAIVKLQELDKFIIYQVELRFDDFKVKVKGVEFSRLLREGYASSATPGQSAAPPRARPQVYKSVKAFLEGRKKPFPWYTFLSTGVPAEEQDCITDYLNSGGSFNDVKTPVIFIKRLMDHETLRAFMPALDKAIEGGMTHCTRTIVDTLNNVIVARMPKRGHLTKFFQKNCQKRYTSHGMPP